MTQDERKVIELALEALKKARRKILTIEECHAAIMFIKEALAQPEQRAQLLFEVDGEMLTASQMMGIELFNFQQATGCDTAAEFLAKPEHDCTRSHPHEEMSKECELRTEIARLTNCLSRVNAQAEHFEREWYLLGDENERLKAQPTSGDYALGYSIGFGEGHSAGKALAQPEDKKCENCGEFGECCQDAQPEQEPENRCIRELREFAKSNQGAYIFPSWDGHRVLKYLGNTTPPQRKEPEQEISVAVLQAITNAGLTLLKTQHGYELRKLGPAIAHNIKE